MAALISDKLRAIFIHNPKCAGVSMMNALVPYSSQWASPLYMDASREECRWSNKEPHPTLQDIYDACNPDYLEELKTYYKFVFIREPLDRLVSLYFFYKQSDDIRNNFEYIYDRVKDKTLEEFLHTEQMNLQVNYKHPDLDFIGLYENIEADWATVCSDLGEEIELNLYNKSKHSPSREYYTRSLEAAARWLLKDDIDWYNQVKTERGLQDD